jgi:3-hydroxyisobutyrate dehydrogenase
MNKPRIAFLGLGTMGSGMARRLLLAGFPLTVFNRNADKAKPFVTEGARAASSPREAASRAEVIFSMVSDNKASQDVWLGEHGALAATTPGTVCIECSTLTVDYVKKLASHVAGRKGEFLDAPVTGTRNPAAAGELSFFVGGNATVLDKVRPVFVPMAKCVTHVGPTGSGAMIKLINNFVCGVQAAALAEAVVMIERSGLDRQQALAVLTEGAPGGPLVKLLTARMTAPDYTPNFLLKLMTKDLGYALIEGKKSSVNLATVEAALTVFQKAIADGQGDKDMAAIVESVRGKGPKPNT